MRGELALDDDGRILALRADVLSDQGAFYSDAQPSKFRAGLFHVVTGSYDFPAAHVTTRGAFTNKAPGGVAYRCSFRITEASYLIERLVQNAAYEIGMDPAELRLKNFIREDQFPYTTPTGLCTTRATTTLPCARPWTRSTTRTCGPSRRRHVPRAGSSASASPTSPRLSAPGRRAPTTSPG